MIERENAVSTHAGNGQISEGKFGARISAGVDGASIGDILIQVCRTGSDVRSQQTDVADDLSDTGLFLSAAVNGKIAPELKSSNNPARGNERLKSDFMVVSESKQKRESATDISDITERRFDKNYNDPALIQRRYRRAQERFMARQSLALPLRLPN